MPAEVTARLNPTAIAEVAALVTAATAVDGVPPLSEHVLLHLQHGGDDGDLSLLLRDADGRLVGYAHLDPTDPVAGASGELVIHPTDRGHGHGGRLVEQLRRLSPDGRLRLWSHGTQPAAAALAARAGFDSVRVLWQMRRSLRTALPEPTWPDGVVVRTFRPGQDEDAWLALNADVFAEHPEQGRLTRQDLQRRMAEPWFDPAGFLLAERSGRLVGYHWTKVHGSTPHHGHERLGEVYVVGVAHSDRGTGLGRALLLAGLRLLRDSGLATAMLYVDAENADAIGLYTALGFTHWDTDAEFRTASPVAGE
jgi:mycothiol synthase